MKKVRVIKKVMQGTLVGSLKIIFLAITFILSQSISQQRASSHRLVMPRRGLEMTGLSKHGAWREKSSKSKKRLLEASSHLQRMIITCLLSLSEILTLLTAKKLWPTETDLSSHCKRNTGLTQPPWGWHKKMKQPFCMRLSRIVRNLEK